MKHTIHTYCFRLLLVAASLLSMLSCTEQEEWQQQTMGTEIRLFAYKPNDSPSTKAADKTKEAFLSGDIIHISATFTPISTQTGVDIPKQYACMKFDGANWTATDGTSLAWPWNAATGTFTAYYIPGTTNALKADETRSLDLSALSQSVIADGKDPLKATYTDIAVGSAVYLQFNHICSKLTFTAIEANIMDKQEIQIEGTGVTKDLTFTLGNDKTLSDQFSTTESPVEGITESVNGNKTLTFLLPPLAKDVKLRMLHQDNSVYHSFTLPQALEAGKHYSLDITKLADNYIDESMKEEDWNTANAAEFTTQEGINAYLKAIRDGKEYRLDDGTQILILTNEGVKKVVAQVKDVDFKNIKFTPVNISENIIFQGNNHRIKNINIVNPINENVTDKISNPADGEICLSLFGKNQGTIKNLILDGVQAEHVSGDQQIGYAGALVGKNINGTIDNVKIFFSGSPAKMTVSSENEKLYIGALAGYSTGTIRNCQISGTGTISATGTGSKAQLFVGGFAGEIAGVTSNCKVIATDFTAEATATDATVRIGGFAGANSNLGKIDSCLCNTKIKLNKGSAASSTGGFIGLAEKDITYSTATGSVDAGTYIAGGFAGQAKNCTFDVCSSTGQITGTGTTGGFAGQLSTGTNGDVTILNSFSTSQALALALAGGMVGSVESGTAHQVLNSFCKNTNPLFTPDKVTVSNCHNNGKKVGDPAVEIAVDELNNGRNGKSGWLEWTATPAVYGQKFPYHIR